MYKIPANTLFIGQSLVFMPECHSTNDEAAALIQRGNVIEGTTIITDHQILGKGQRGNTWASESLKNLTFSIVLKPIFLPIEDQFYLNIAVTLGVHSLLSELLGHEVKIKWPNDILVGDKKVCGVLIENSVSGQQLRHSIVGIGINVNQEKFNIEKASSMKLIAGRTFILPEVLEGVLEKIERYYLLLRELKTGVLFSEFKNKMYWLEEVRLFSANQNKFEGKIIGMDSTGRLQIETNGGVRVYGMKEVEFLH